MDTKSTLLFLAIFLFGTFVFFNPLQLEMIGYLNNFGYGFMLMILAPIGLWSYNKVMKIRRNDAFSKSEEQDGN